MLLWDESEHVSPKKSKELSAKFWKAYLYAFPEGIEAYESPTIVATGSPMFAKKPLTHFWHRGLLLPYEKENKDLAIVKYAATGLVDQDKRFRFLLDDLRTLRQQNGHPPIVSDDASLVLFITSDKANGMTSALRTTFENRHELRTNFSSLQIDQAGQERMELAGSLIGKELKKRFVKNEGKALLIDIDFTYA